MSATVELRPPDVVMRLARMGSFHQSRLSFMRILLRRIKDEAWTFDRPRFDIDEDGVGIALYTATTPDRTYTLVAFAHDLPDDMRSDRVIATAWDCTFALHDGVATEADVERLRANVPLQEVGRISGDELTLSRANRSVRLWSTVVDALAAGRQPDVEAVENVGYLMRTTAVYGSGKFGAADRQSIADRPELIAPFQAEMLTVYLIRTFVMDLVEHMAAVASPDAVRLDPEIRRRFGIGNSTGLGMAPFLVTHPRLINNWILAREEALARVRGVESATADEVDVFRGFVRRARRSVELWHSEHEMQKVKLVALRQDLDALDEYVATISSDDVMPWDALMKWAETALSLEGQELVVSLMLEPYGPLVDELSETMHADESSPASIDGSTTVSMVRDQLAANYGWALEIDWNSADANARAWYVSEEKLEPRLGERESEPIGEYEQPLQPGRDAARMYADLATWDPAATLARFLRVHPEHRHMARRLTVVHSSPYSEIRDNTIDATMLPIDMLRAKLAFFGATHFDPRSDRWVRINMFRGAPFPDELATTDPDGWTYPLENPAA
ncbi:MAG: hypothetical protein HKN94_09775 [Acidimicrobiales bacterium]|nr:hypothetical protein [Acidimicrobiales bacterium]RZV48297.1 MAG: hypothetical protein EX269_02185 [Acidimicrobiales bacterium]